MTEPIEIWPDKVCYTRGSKRYHRAAYQMFNQSCWWTKDRGFVRSVCGVIDSHRFAYFRCLHQGAEKFLKRARDSRLVACRRCFPDGPPDSIEKVKEMKGAR